MKSEKLYCPIHKETQLWKALSGLKMTVYTCPAKGCIYRLEVEGEEPEI